MSGACSGAIPASNPVLKICCVLHGGSSLWPTWHSNLASRMGWRLLERQSAAHAGDQGAGVAAGGAVPAAAAHLRGQAPAARAHHLRQQAAGVRRGAVAGGVLDLLRGRDLRPHHVRAPGPAPRRRRAHAGALLIQGLLASMLALARRNAWQEDLQMNVKQNIGHHPTVWAAFVCGDALCLIMQARRKAMYVATGCIRSLQAVMPADDGRLSTMREAAYVAGAAACAFRHCGGEGQPGDHARYPGRPVAVRQHKGIYSILSWRSSPLTCSSNIHLQKRWVAGMYELPMF